MFGVIIREAPAEVTARVWGLSLDELGRHYTISSHARCILLQSGACALGFSLTELAYDDVMMALARDMSERL